MSVSIKLNTKAFLKYLDGNIATSLDKIGQVGVDNVEAECPIDSGELVSNNYYTSNKVDSVTIENNTDYAAYVEFGTYKMAANPFMRRGINNSRGEFVTIITSNLKV